ncbi:MAG: hypothetical protein II816_02855 [Elusimicrobia bacterium]|nr:hypothetical protein [Elusimicrobiota bacterium]
MEGKIKSDCAGSWDDLTQSLAFAHKGAKDKDIKINQHSIWFISTFV